MNCIIIKGVYMVEWRGIKFYKTEAESKKEEAFTGINVDMRITEAKKVKTDEIKINFRYSAEFTPNIAILTLYGYVLVGGNEKELNGFVDSWQKKKMLPKEIAEPLANLITFSSEVNGVLVAKALNMPVPVIPPRISLSKEAK